MVFSKTLFLFIGGLILVQRSILVQCFDPSSSGQILSGVLAQYAGSTPGDQQLIKSYLHIPKELHCDFIRWDLKLLDPERFDLSLNYGESKPNTLGFVNDGIHISYKGHYKTEHSDLINQDILNFTSDDHAIHFPAVKLNDHLIHILNNEHKLMVGNGGWSFTLNRQSAAGTSVENLPMLRTLFKNINPVVQEKYDGRTPSAGFTQDHGLQANRESFKLKWGLVLNRDPNTLVPTTYSLRNVINNEPNDITGTWKLFHGTTANPDALIYQIDIDKPKQTIRLLVGDENVLFFLDKQDRLYTGNKDFSFTMNRKI